MRLDDGTRELRIVPRAANQRIPDRCARASELRPPIFVRQWTTIVADRQERQARGRARGECCKRRNPAAEMRLENRPFPNALEVACKNSKWPRMLSSEEQCVDGRRRRAPKPVNAPGGRQLVRLGVGCPLTGGCDIDQVAETAQRLVGQACTAWRTALCTRGSAEIPATGTTESTATSKRLSTGGGEIPAIQ